MLTCSICQRDCITIHDREPRFCVFLLWHNKQQTRYCSIPCLTPTLGNLTNYALSYIDRPLEHA